MKTYVHVWKYLSEFFLEWNVSDKSCRENQNTHFMFGNFFFLTNCAILWQYGKYGKAGLATDDNKIRRMRPACWITKVTDAHSEYVILLAFPRQQLLRERASMLRYIYIACVVIIWHIFFKSLSSLSN